MDGLLNINKPPGPTSFDIVAKVRKLSGERRVGHAGTLDPTATGVLPVCLGQATRVTEFLVDSTKVYRAEIELGTTTDTYDASGVTTKTGDISEINREQLESSLTSFRGTIQQVPPLYSAIKYQGKPLYELARAGITVERKSRPVTIHNLDLLDWQPPVITIEAACGKGTYIRSLAYDLGENLGCGAHLKSLIRLRYGLFEIKDAVPLPELEEAFRSGHWQELIHPIDSVLLHFKAVVVDDNAREDIRNGRPLNLEDTDTDRIDNNPKLTVPDKTFTENRCRAYSLDGSFLGILRLDPEKGHWQPQKIFL